MGHSPTDYLGVLTAYLARGGRCDKIYTLSYFSHGSAGHLAGQLGAGATMVFLGHSHVLAPSAVPLARSLGVRVVGVVSWRSAAQALESVGVEAVTTDLSWYYRRMSSRVKARVDTAARLADAMAERRWTLARAIGGRLGELVELASSSEEEVDPDSVGLSVARSLESLLPLRPRKAVELAMRILDPKPIMSIDEVGLEVYTARLPSRRASILLKVVARELLRLGGARAVIVAAPGKQRYYFAGVSRVEASWSLGPVAGAYGIIGNFNGLAQAPTFIEGAAPPGAKLLGALKALEVRES